MTDGGKERKKIHPTEWERTEKNNEFRIIFCLSYRRLDFAGRKTSLWHVRVSPVSPDYRLSRSAYDKNHKFPQRGIILAVDDEWERRANMRATHILARGFPFIDFLNLAMWLSFRLATEEELECQFAKRCILTSGDSRTIFYLTSFLFFFFRFLEIDLTALHAADIWVLCKKNICNSSPMLYRSFRYIVLFPT